MDPIKNIKDRSDIDLSILIITYNSQPLLAKCLDSIFKTIKNMAFEVILINNNSQDGTREYLDEHYPGIKVVHNDVNRGVAPARNQALKLAKGKFLLIIDDDAEMISDNFQDMIDLMTAHPEIGLVGCTSIAYDNSVHYSKRTFPTPLHVILRRLSGVSKFRPYLENSKTLRLHHLKEYVFNEPTEVNMLEGVFQLISRTAFEKVGLLDETMFYGNEDADYCARMQKAGFKCFYFPNYRIYHRLNAITKKGLFQKTVLYHFISYSKFYRRHRSWIKKKNRELLKNMGLLP